MSLPKTLQRKVTIQKNVERNFTNVFDWKPFRDSSAWRCNQRVSTCEFDPVICVCQYGNHVAQSVPGVPDMQLNHRRVHSPMLAS